MPINACVLTVSDRGAAGLREDTSSPALRRALEAAGISVLSAEIVPDEPENIIEALLRLSDQADLILTTGGTGLSPRDITPESTRSVIDREIPGIAEAMRAAGMQATRRAMLSRGIAGARGHTLIINLPGSEKAAMEGLMAIVDVLEHAIDKLKGSTEDCGR